MIHYLLCCTCSACLVYDVKLYVSKKLSPSLTPHSLTLFFRKGNIRRRGKERKENPL